MQASREKYSNVAIMFILTSFIYIGIDIFGIYFLNKLTNNVFYNNGFDNTWILVMTIFKLFSKTAYTGQ